MNEHTVASYYKLVSVVASRYDDILDIFAGSYIETMSNPLIVVDDGLSDTIKDKYKDFIYTPAPQPFHWSKSINKGIRLAGTADVIVFNDDCFIHTKNLDKVLQMVAYASEDIGATSALRNDRLDRSLAERVGVSVKNDYELYLLQVENCSNGCLYADGIPYMMIKGDRPILTAAYIKRSVLDLVGLLDEFFLIDREDVDWGLRMLAAGYTAALVYGAFVEHGGDKFKFPWSNSRRLAGITGTRQIDREHFDEKWGKIASGELKIPVRSYL